MDRFSREKKAKAMTIRQEEICISSILTMYGQNVVTVIDMARATGAVERISINAVIHGVSR